MRTLASLAVATAFMAVGPLSARVQAAESEGVALAVIYDTSGSMKDSVPDRAGKSAPKYTIANRALIEATRQIQVFATNTAGGPPRAVSAGLFVFQGGGAREAVRFGPFDAQAMENFAKSFSNPNGNTPLGNALTAASRVVLSSPLSRKHILVITDGMNTAGPDPASVLPGIQRQAAQKQTPISVHFLAFDVDAKVFDGVKKLGATVVSAADEKQLSSQLEFILKRKILLEDEEPKH